MSVCCAALLLLGGCGDDGDERADPTLPTPAATVQDTPEPTPTPTATATPAPADEGGDEAGNRVDVEVTLGVEDVDPAQLEVPAFLGLRLRVRNESGAERVLRLRGQVVLELLPGETATAEVEGLRPGEHLLEAGASGRVVLTARRADDGGTAVEETGGTEAPSP